MSKWLIIFSIIFIQTVFAAFNIEEATIHSIHTAIHSKQLTCEQLINIYLDRIKKYNLGVAQSARIKSSK